MHDTLTDEQLAIVDAIRPHLQDDADHTVPKVFFVDGPGGSGKTYLYIYLIHYLRSFDKKVMVTATTGIAATLLPGGQTAHSAFKIPIPCLENGVCRISPSSPYAEELRNTHLFMIDEASMLSSFVFNALDRLFRDITRINVPFGSKIILLGADLGQTLSVVKRATNTMILEHCILSSPLWNIVKQFKLTSNIRANSDEHTFKSFLIDLREGKLPTKNTQPFIDCIEIPSSFMTNNNIIDDIFPEEEISLNPTNIIKRAILCPTNKETIDINLDVLSRVSGDSCVYSSVDSIQNCLDEEEAANYPVEFLNSLTPSGMPSHNLFLKEGAIVILLRNINTKQGLTNGTRLIIKRMYNLFLDAQILTGRAEGHRVFIPKMNLVPSDIDLPFSFCRVQFPLRLAYAMTINKSQGQTFDKVGIFLNKACFAHGQLYVAFSRARSHKDVYVKVIETPQQGKYRGRTYTKNVVLRQVLSQN